MDPHTTFPRICSSLWMSLLDKGVAHRKTSPSTPDRVRICATIATRPARAAGRPRRLVCAGRASPLRVARPRRRRRQDLTQEVLDTALDLTHSASTLLRP